MTTKLLHLPMPNFYKPSTRTAVAKTDCLNMYKSHTQLAVVKTDSELLYIILQTYSINALCNFYKPPCQNLLSKLLQPPIGPAVVNSELLQASYTHFGGQNIPNFLKPSTTLYGGEN